MLVMLGLGCQIATNPCDAQIDCKGQALSGLVSIEAKTGAADAHEQLMLLMLGLGGLFSIEAKTGAADAHDARVGPLVAEPLQRPSTADWRCECS